MADVLWPTLQLGDCIPPDGYREQWIGGQIKSDMESGPPKIRRRFTRSRRRFSAQKIWTLPLYEFFWSWWDINLGGGTLAFQITHPISKALLSVRFDGMPTVTMLGPLAVSIAFELEEV